ncbi:uncharacterized protein LOC120085457 isoform X2 [Benincasa hispida]|uniref:uncharacterized protein LOC120085457 isoform X2 n=1 Tax=Benincasa hispida TaxID=102211 RepID=UPI0018FF7444|nr:uncharacterized protein LOC120085457 isoform X2 [Benincasa hispida]
MENIVEKEGENAKCLFGERKSISFEKPIKAKPPWQILKDEEKKAESKRKDIDQYVKKVVDGLYTKLVDAKPILRRFSSIEKKLNCLDGITEILKLKMEQNLLFHLKRFRSSLDNTNKITFGVNDRHQFKKATSDYFSLLIGGQGSSHIDLLTKLLRLRDTLVEYQNEYINILQGKWSKNKEDVLQNIVQTRRELEYAEKVYLISRRRYIPKLSTGVDLISSKYSSDYDGLLSQMICRKEEMMKLEGEYVALLRAGATFSNDVLSRYSEDILQRAVSSKRDSLIIDELSSNEIIGERTWSLFDVQPIYFRRLCDVISMMLSMRFYSLWERPDMYPNLVEDFKIDYKTNRLENLVNLRKEYLMVEDEYLWVLQERHTKNHANTSTSFSVHQIHSEYVWEYLFDTILCWKNDLRLLEDTCARKLGEKYSNKWSYECDDLEEIEKLKKELKEAEEECCELIQKKHLTILNDIPSMDVTQIYAKYIHQELLDEIVSLRVKIKMLERDYHRILSKPSYVYNQQDRQEFESVGTGRERLWDIEQQYFDRLKYNIAAKNFLQPPDLKMEAFESLDNNVEEEEFLTTLYYSVKSFNIYCVECMSYINNLIKRALGLEDDEELSAIISFEGENVGEMCNDVVDKFLYSRSICCPICIKAVRMATIQQKNTSTASGQTSTSIPNQGDEAICNQEDSTITMPLDEIICVQQSSNVGRWKIRRCIVLGGLIQSITSLVIVTAATTANMSDGNIVTLAFTNLITGLFIVRHDLGSWCVSIPTKQRWTQVLVLCPSHSEDHRYSSLTFCQFLATPISQD